MLVEDLGTMNYRDAWTAQERAHAEVLDGGPERVFLVEHPPVITFGRRPGLEKHLLAAEEQLANLGMEVVNSDRGGDITFHGPGQLVAYPIVRLADHQLSVSGYVHTLEKVVVDLLAEFKIEAYTDSSAVGVWVKRQQQPDAKVCAIGVRIRRGVTLHGLALNVNTDLDYFNLIVPCGLVNRPVTSLKELLGAQAPSIQTVKDSLIRHLTHRLRQSVAC